MGMKLTGPIPGQSLTREQGNSPWEQPPLYARPEAALANHLKQLSKGNRMDDLLFLVGEGFPISTFVDSLMTTSVMEGYHTADVSQLIAPVLHTYIKEAAQSAGLTYKEWDGPSPEEVDKERFKERLNIKFGSMLQDKSPQATEAASPFTPPMAENTPTEQIGTSAQDPATTDMSMAQGGFVVPKMKLEGPSPVESLGSGQGYVQKRSMLGG